MNRTDLLEQITRAAKENIITKDELLHAYNKSEHSEKNLLSFFSTKHNFYLATLIIFLGGVIICAGLLTLLLKYWALFSIPVKIILTLAIGLVVYVVALFVNLDKRLSLFSAGFFLISAAVFDTGLPLFFYQVRHVDRFSNESISLSALVLFFLYAVSYFFISNEILILLSVGFGTVFFITFTNLLESYWHLPSISSSYDISYKIFIIGIAYIIFSYWLFYKGKKNLSSLFVLLGNAAALYAALLLTRSRYNPNHYWELIFGLLIISSLYLSLFIKNVLPLTSIFLVLSNLILLGVFMFGLTERYFKNSLSWPVALILIGNILVVIGGLFLKSFRKFKPKPM